MTKSLLNFFSLLFSLSIFAFFFSSCGEEFYFVKKITIKGQILELKKKVTESDTAGNNAFTLGDTKRILIFCGNEYDLVDINNQGKFSGKAPLGTATAVVFLTQDNKFIGNLFVNGLNFLPLAGMNDNITEIDLSVLKLDGTHVIPANNPIGNQINLTVDELQFLKEIGSYYEALSKNIDMNNDSIPDMLQDAFIDITTVQDVKFGTCGLNNTTPMLLPPDEFGYSYSLYIRGPNSLLSSTDNSVAENAVLSGPADNPYSDIGGAWNAYLNPRDWKLNFSRQNGTLPFGPGEYKIKIDNKEFTFFYSRINMKTYTVISVPTIITNGNDEIVKITLTYQLPDGTPVEPEKLILSGIKYELGELWDWPYESLPHHPDYDFYTIIPKENVKLSSISNLGLSYYDLFGNEVHMNWDIK